MNNLSKEQIEQIQVDMKNYFDEEVKKKVSELDKTLDVAVEKLVKEGWTLPAELPITAVNALGNTDILDDVNSFMEQFYAYDDYRNMKAMLKGIQESKIKEGLKNWLMNVGMHLIVKCMLFVQLHCFLLLREYYRSLVMISRMFE